VFVFHTDNKSPSLLVTVTCVATMLLFLRFWKLSRKNGPRIPPFVHPGNDGDFQPIGEDMDGEGYDEGGYGKDDEGHKPLSNRYGEGGDGQCTGGRGNMPVKYDTGAPTSAIYTRTDPFADSNYMPRQSYDYGAYRGAGATSIPDPYAAIQSQLRSEQPPQLPPFYRGG
jgi:hypothetical protein